VKKRFPALILLSAILLPSFAHGAGKFTLLPFFNLVGEWTDNYLLAAEDDPEDEKLALFSVSATPGLRLRYDTFRTETSVFFAATFKHVFEEEERGGWPEYYDGGLGWSFWATSRVRTTVGDEFAYFTDPRDQPFVEGGEVETLRTESIANRLFTRVSYNISRLSALEGGYAFATTEFREDEVSDSAEHQFDIQWSRQLSQTHRLLLFYNYNRALFSPHYDFLRHWWDDEVTMDPGFPVSFDQVNDFDTHTPGVGLLYLATSSLSFEVRSGVIFPAQEINGAYQLRDLEWFQRMDVIKAFWRIRTGVSYSRNYAPAHGLEGGVVSDTVSGRIGEQWLRRLETSQEIAYTHYRQEITEIDAARATADINYYFFNWLGLGMAYNYLEQWSEAAATGDTAQVIAHRVTLRLALATPRPDWLRF